MATTVDTSGATLDLGRKRRTVSPALRRALRARDRSCRFPGCAHAHWLHAHHIEHWAHGGATLLENTVLLCSTHHRYVHEYGFDVQRDSCGVLVFLDATGQPITHNPAPAKPQWLRPVAAEVNTPAWDGRPVQYNRCIDSLMN